MGAGTQFHGQFVAVGRCVLKRDLNSVSSALGHTTFLCTKTKRTTRAIFKICRERGRERERDREGERGRERDIGLRWGVKYLVQIVN